MYLDECGFSPTQPVNYSWTLAGRRKLVAYENPEGRRVNVLAALTYAHRTCACSSLRSPLRWVSLPRTLKADDLVRFVSSIQHSTRLTVVVLDNASMHRSRLVKSARKELARRGIVLYFLPPYSPELNLIEPVFGVIKHYDMPERSYDSVEYLTMAVDAAFERANHRCTMKTEHHLRPAA